MVLQGDREYEGVVASLAIDEDQNGSFIEFTCGAPGGEEDTLTVRIVKERERGWPEFEGLLGLLRLPVTERRRGFAYYEVKNRLKILPEDSREADVVGTLRRIQVEREDIGFVICAQIDVQGSKEEYLLHRTDMPSGAFAWHVLLKEAISTRNQVRIQTVQSLHQIRLWDDEGPGQSNASSDS